MTPDEFIQKLKDYLNGKGTLEAVRKQFWSDTTNMEVRFKYIEKLVERSVYDSTIRHLSVVAEDKQYGALAKESRKSLAQMRFATEGNPKYLAKWLTTITKNNIQDSVDGLNAHFSILSYWQQAKKVDSLRVWYEKVFAYTGTRDADLLNNYAWDVVSFSTKYDTAMAIINEAIAKNPNEPNYYDTKALIYYKKYDGKSAVESAEKALSLAPKDDNAYFQDRVRFYKKEFEFDELEKQDNDKK
jgi:Tfp pilus assembly protein PilF